MTNDAVEIEANIVENPNLPVVHPARIVGGIPHLEEYLLLAERISRTAMVPATFRNKPDEVLAVVMYGAELGIGPMQALQQINFVAGKPSASAELLRALVMEQGHQFILSGNGDEAIAQCRRKDWDEWRETRFTISDARRAGLSNGDNWKKYPDAMLAARVTSKACRLYFPDVISGMSYTPEEVESFTTPRSTTSSHSTTESESVNYETGEVASDDQLYGLTTSIGLLQDEDRLRLKVLWHDANLPPIKRGLTAAQAERATQLVMAVLNTVGDDVVEAEVVESFGNESNEPATSTSEVTSSLATAPQIRAIQTLFAKVGVAGPAKHEMAAAIIGRSPIESMSDLTKSEASEVIERLKSDADT